MGNRASVNWLKALPEIWNEIFLCLDIQSIGNCSFTYYVNC